MASSGTIYDAMDVAVGQDADTHPSYLPNGYHAEALNRQFRGGINRTRPVISQLTLEASEGQDEDILDQIAYGNFQGAWPYRALKYDSNDGLIVAIAGNIYFFGIVNDKAVITKIAEGNDNDLLHTWFCQAEDQLYIQNGRQNALVWDGVAANPATRLNPLLGKMPIGTLMEYAYGRVFVSDVFNNVYASDIIYGTGFTTTTNTQNFTETQYWQEGGSFTAPSNLGNLTGIKVAPSININDRGQGELVFFCERGAYTLNAQIPRDQWKDAQIQKVTMVGRGNLSPWSLTPVNNEIFFRSDDGWSAYSNSQLDFTNRFGFRKLSREVNKWVSNDTPWMRQFASGMFFDNRLIATVSPYLVPPRTANEGQGLHRPHRGMVVLDLDISESTSPDSGISFRWNGVWTGPRPTQLLKAYIRGQERAFIFSFDADGQNRLYELKTTTGNDYGAGRTRKIKSYFISKRFDFSGSQATNKFIRKRLTGGDIWLSEIADEVCFSVDYRPDSYPCWNTLLPEQCTGCDECDPDCDFEFSQDRFKRIRFPSPETECQIGIDIETDQGAEFQVKVKLEGEATVDRLRLMANIGDNADAPIGDCPGSSNESCEPITCCPTNIFDFYQIVEP